MSGLTMVTDTLVLIVTGHGLSYIWPLTIKPPSLFLANTLYAKWENDGCDSGGSLFVSVLFLCPGWPPRHFSVDSLLWGNGHVHTANIRVVLRLSVAGDRVLMEALVLTFREFAGSLPATFSASGFRILLSASLRISRHAVDVSHPGPSLRSRLSPLASRQRPCRPSIPRPLRNVVATQSPAGFWLWFVSRKPPQADGLHNESEVPRQHPDNLDSLLTFVALLHHTRTLLTAFEFKLTLLRAAATVLCTQSF